MNSYRAGDFTAFEKLYARHKGKVYGYIKGRVGEAHSDDVYQAVFARLHQKKHLFKSDYPFLPWFFTLIRNVIVDHHRREKIKYQPLPEEIGAEAESSLEEIEELKELNLTEEQFKLLYMKFVEGKGYKELETEFDSSSSALRKQVSRVMQKLRGRD